MTTRTTEDIFETTDAADLCVEAGVDPDLHITKFVMQDYAACIIEEMEEGNLTKEQALELLKIANPAKLANQLLELSHWVDIWRIGMDAAQLD